MSGSPLPLLAARALAPPRAHPAPQRAHTTRTTRTTTQALRSMFLDLISKKGGKRIDFLFAEGKLDGLTRAQKRRSTQIVKMMQSTFFHEPMRVTLKILRAAMKREGVPLTTKDLRVLFDVLNPVNESIKQIQQAERVGVTLEEAQQGCDRFFTRRRMRVNFKRLVNAIKQAGKEKRAMRGSLEVRSAPVLARSSCSACALHCPQHTHAPLAPRAHAAASPLPPLSSSVCGVDAPRVKERLRDRHRCRQGARRRIAADPRVDQRPPGVSDL